MHIGKLGDELHLLDLSIGISGYNNGIQQFLHIAVFRFNLQFAAADFAQIQRLIDEIQHKLAGCPDFFQILLTLIFALALYRQLGKAQNTVQRRAHIMAYIGNKRRLGRGLALYGQHALIALFLRHIVDEMGAGKMAVPGNPLFLDIEIAVTVLVMTYEFLLAVHLQAFELAVLTDMFLAKHVVIAGMAAVTATQLTVIHGRPVGIQKLLRFHITNVHNGIHILQQLELRLIALTGISEGQGHYRRVIELADILDDGMQPDKTIL